MYKLKKLIDIIANPSSYMVKNTLWNGSLTQESIESIKDIQKIVGIHKYADWFSEDAYYCLDLEFLCASDDRRRVFPLDSFQKKYAKTKKML